MCASGLVLEDITWWAQDPGVLVKGLVHEDPQDLVADDGPRNSGRDIGRDVGLDEQLVRELLA